MRGLWMIGLVALALAGCAINPGPENTNPAIEDSEMMKTSDTPELSSAEDPLPGKLLFDFENETQAWVSVDDNVMGGVSRSDGQILENGTLLFSGVMSLENNGGFSSIRSPWNPIDLSEKDGLLIHVLGDGKVYRMRIRTTATGQEISYNSFFETRDGEWTTVYLPFETMVPTLRGFQVGSGELNPATISSFGFMLSDKQPGEFALQVDWIRAVTEEEIFPDGIPASGS